MLRITAFHADQALPRSVHQRADMPEELSMRDLDDGERRAVNRAAALAEEQLKYATAIACKVAPAGEDADRRLVASLVQAIATNFAAVK